MPERTGRRLTTAHRPRGAGISARLILAVQLLVVLALLSWTGAGGLAAGDVRPSQAAIVGFVQQGAKLVPIGEKGEVRFGRSVALSADGNTALVGGPRDGSEIGAAWVFTRSGSTWTQQAKLTVGKTEGSHYFGRGVALSADGSTALIGDPGNGSNTGAAWVFTRSGSTWTAQARLAGAGEVGAGEFGRGVALSADGGTALIGAFADNAFVGAAWVFTRAGSSWTQQGVLTGGGEAGAGYFGRTVALSASGDTALIGGIEDERRAGAAWVFTRSGSTWAQQGPKLTGGEESGKAELGSSVALSEDGSTALVGGNADAEGTGAAWVFTRSGSTWAEQGPKLTGGGEVGAGSFGHGVALSGDGSIALIGGLGDAAGTGAAWVFARSGSAWVQQGVKLTGAGEVGEGLFGYPVALSADGSTALIGGLGDNGGLGAAWVFVKTGEGEPPHEEKPHEEPMPHEEKTETQAHEPPAANGLPVGGEAVLSTVTVAPPVLGISGNVQPVSGKVYVRLPHSSGFELLSGLRQIPVGTVVDATAGRVLVTTALPHGGSESAEFFAGEFTLTQRRNGVVIAILTGGHVTICNGAHRAARRARTSTRHGHTRRLWANAHGTFSTKGNYAAGAVQGTEWLTEDTCEGTLILVTRDKVKVTDLVRHRSFIVRAGHRVLVKR